MTIAELLKQNGIDDDTIEKVVSGMKENKIYTSGEENIDIRYGKLKEQHGSVTAELDEARKKIAELEKSSEGTSDLQGKISEYESKVADLERQLIDVRTKSAIKVGLLSERPVDIDYLTFKLQSKLHDDGKSVELDDNGNIKGWNDIISALKTQFPTQFEGSVGGKKIEEHKLESGDDQKISSEDFNKMSYNERLKLYKENPETYRELSGKN